MLANFYTKTTVVYTINITVDGATPAFDVNDVFTLIFKKSINDTDAEAIITATGVKTDTDGEVVFTLSSSDTAYTGKYYYEIKWVSLNTEKIIESSTVTIMKRVFD